MGALSFSPSPMTTTPSIGTVSRIRRIASTAAWSAASFCPFPIQRAADRAAASVTRTSSKARLRSGADDDDVPVPAPRLPFIFSLIGSSFQAAEHALRRLPFEQDGVHLREKGKIQAGIAR